MYLNKNNNDKLVQFKIEFILELLCKILHFYCLCILILRSLQELKTILLSRDYRKNMVNAAIDKALAIPSVVTLQPDLKTVER